MSQNIELAGEIYNYLAYSSQTLQRLVGYGISSYKMSAMIKDWNLLLQKKDKVDVNFKNK